MPNYHQIPGRDVCAANVARMVAEFIEAHYDSIIENDERHALILPDGGGVIVSSLTGASLAIMPVVPFRRENGQWSNFSPDSHSMLSRGAIIHREDLRGTLHAIGLVCERARRAAKKWGQ